MYGEHGRTGLSPDHAVTVFVVAQSVSCQTSTPKALKMLLLASYRPAGRSLFIQMTCRRREVQISTLCRTALAIQCDVTKWENQVKMFQQAVAEYGHLDIVVPAAGVTEFDRPDFADDVFKGELFITPGSDGSNVSQPLYGRHRWPASASESHHAQYQPDLCDVQ